MSLYLDHIYATIMQEEIVFTGYFTGSIWNTEGKTFNAGSGPSLITDTSDSIYLGFHFLLLRKKEDQNPGMMDQGTQQKQKTNNDQKFYKVILNKQSLWYCGHKANR